MPTQDFSRLALIVSVLAVTAPSLAADRPQQSRNDESGFVKVAAVQLNGYDKGDLPRKGYDPTEKMIPYIDRAGSEGVAILVFPEYLLGHISVPSESTDKISTAAKRNQVHVLVGCWEEFDDGTYANTALLFGRSGKILGKYQKTHAAVDNWEGTPPWSTPPMGKDLAWFREKDPEWKMEKGQEFPVFDLDFGKVGIMTCYDGWFPEPPRILSLKGAELIVWMNGRGGSVEDFIVKSIMFQSHVAMITSNQAYGSGTMIGDASNRQKMILERSPDRTESYITATINFKNIRHIRTHSRNFQQRRPELYHDLTKPIFESKVR